MEQITGESLDDHPDDCADKDIDNDDHRNSKITQGFGAIMMTITIKMILTIIMR